MRRPTAGLLGLLLASACEKAPVAAAAPPEAPEPAAPAAHAATLTSDDQKTAYALGVFQANGFADARLSPEEIAALEAGFEDASAKRPLQVAMAEYGPKAQNFVMRRRGEAQRAAAKIQRAKDATFLASAATEAGVEKLPSGLLFKALKPGTGASPGINDRARVRYQGHLADGTPIEGTAQHGDSETLSLPGTIPCWNEALRRMKVGESAQLICPPALAFGDQGRLPQVPPGATLVFNLELLEVLPPAPPKARGKASPKPDDDLR